MNLKTEVISSLKREEEICKLAIRNIRQKCSRFEKKYHMTTDEFLSKFSQGKLGDEQDFFEWQALSKGIEDWEKTRDSLQEIMK